MSAAPTTADTPTPPPGKRERNKAEKRRRIVEAAEKLFREKGFEATTTAEISAAAGVGTGTLYLYVDSKEDLLVEVFRVEVGQAWDAAFETADPADPLVDQLLAIFGHMADYHLQDPVLAKAYFRDMMFTTGPVAEAVSVFMRGIFDRLEEVLVGAQARDGLSAEVDRHFLARNLFAVWYFAMQRNLGRGAPHRTGDAIDRSIRASLTGLTTTR